MVQRQKNAERLRLLLHLDTLNYERSDLITYSRFTSINREKTKQYMKDRYMLYYRRMIYSKYPEYEVSVKNPENVCIRTFFTGRDIERRTR